MHTNGISRRSLVKAAALVPYAAVRGTAANSAVTVGLIGCGGRGTFDAQLLIKDPNARLVALCDLFDEQIEKARKNIPISSPRTYRDYREMLAAPDIDAVIIATPVYLHPEHFEVTVRARKHVYIEKPAGADIEGCRRVMRAGDLADRRLNIAFGFQQRYAPVYHKAKKLLDSGGIGAIQMAHAHWIKGAVKAGRMAPVPRPTNDIERVRLWKFWRDSFGDIIVETYCHGVDVLNWFLGGHPEKAYGTGGATVERRGDNMDHCDATFTYANNVQAILTGSQIAPGHYRSVHEQFFGTEAVIETAREYWKHYRARGEAAEEKSAREITIDALEEFIRRIKGQRPENAAISAAHSTLTAIMARTAMYEKREVTWAEMMKA